MSLHLFRVQSNLSGVVKLMDETKTFQNNNKQNILLLILVRLIMSPFHISYPKWNHSFAAQPVRCDESNGWTEKFQNCYYLSTKWMTFDDAQVNEAIKQYNLQFYSIRIMTNPTFWRSLHFVLMLLLCCYCYC